MADLPEQLVVSLSADINKLDKQLKKALGSTADFARKQEGMYKDSFAKVERMAAELDVQNKLTIARASHDDPRTRELQEQLELSKQIQRFRLAGKDQGAAEAAARSHIAAVAAAQATAAAAQRTAAMEQIALDEKLQVARARGDRREVEALDEQLALSRAIAKYKGAGFSEAQSKEMAENQLAALTGARRQAKRGNLGEAVEGTLEHARLGVLEEGGARLGIYGGALEALGPAGLAAAAGLAATAVAGEKARQSMEWAEDLQKTSETLGVTTTRLQEFDEASIATGIGQDKAREGLQQFNEVFGKYSAGLANGRSAKFLNALGFTPETARQIGDVSGALDKALMQLAKVRNPQQRASLANQLGLTNFLPVLAEGTAGVARFVEAMRKAGASGSIVSEDQIRRTAELNDKVGVLAHRIDQEFKEAFIDAAPAIESVATFIEKCTSKLADFIGEIPNAVRGLQDLFGAIGKDKDASKQDLLDRFDTGLQSFANGPVGHALNMDHHLERGAWNGLVTGGKVAGLKGGVDDLLAGKVSDPEGRRQYDEFGQKTGQDLAGPAKTKRAPDDKTEDLDTSTKEARDAAAKELASAQAELAKGFLEHAQHEKDAVDADTAKKLADLAKQEATVRNAKVDAHKAQQLAALATAAQDTKSAQTAKQEAIDRNAAEAQQAFQIEMADRIAGALAAHLENEASIADTSGERRKLELQALQVRQDQEQRDFNDHAKDDLRDHRKTQVQIDQAQADMNQRYDDQRSNIIRSTDSPGRAFDRQLNQQQGDLSDQLETVEVSGVEKLGDALDEVITRTKTAKEAFRDMAMSIVGDLLKIDIQRNLEKPLADALFGKPAVSAQVGPISSGLGAFSLGSPSGSLDTALTNTGMDPTGNGDSNLVGKGISFMGSLTKLLGIPGFAEGTDDAPGGETLVGERGPELVKLPGGSQVMTNDAVRNLPTAGPGSVGQTVHLTHRVTIDLTGANGDQAIAQASHAAAVAAYSQAMAYTQKSMQRAARSRTQSLVGH